VDYYNFGECQVHDGAYFCGDHSCNTFKWVSPDAGGYVQENIANATTRFKQYDTQGNLLRMDAITYGGDAVRSWHHMPVGTFVDAIGGNRRSLGIPESARGSTVGLY